MRIGMREDKALDKLIQSFLDYFPPEIENFHKAVGQFKRDLPQVLAALRKTIDDALGGKPAFREAADDFLAHCKTAINPEVEAADVREMLIQHILTKDISFGCLTKTSSTRKTTSPPVWKSWRKPFHRQCAPRDGGPPEKLLQRDYANRRRHRRPPRESRNFSKTFMRTFTVPTIPRRPSASAWCTRRMKS